MKKKFCEDHPETTVCLSKSQRSTISLAKKQTPAIHLTNLTAFFPRVADDIHELVGRAIIYDSRSRPTINTLIYGSPWALMDSYRPRETIMSARSTISATSLSISGKASNSLEKSNCCKDLKGK